MEPLTIHVQEELTAGALVVVFFVWVTVTLAVGLFRNRPKNHHIRLRAKAARRAKYSGLHA